MNATTHTNFHSITLLRSVSLSLCMYVWMCTKCITLDIDAWSDLCDFKFHSYRFLWFFPAYVTKLKWLSRASLEPLHTFCYTPILFCVFSLYLVWLLASIKRPNGNLSSFHSLAAGSLKWVPLHFSTFPISSIQFFGPYSVHGGMQSLGSSTYIVTLLFFRKWNEWLWISYNKYVWGRKS